MAPEPIAVPAAVVALFRLFVLEEAADAGLALSARSTSLI